MEETVKQVITILKWIAWVVYVIWFAYMCLNWFVYMVLYV